MEEIPNVEVYQTPKYIHGHINYERGKRGSQVVSLQRNKTHGGRRLWWMSGSTRTSDFNTGSCCLLPIVDQQSAPEKQGQMTSHAVRFDYISIWKMKILLSVGYVRIYWHLTWSEPQHRYVDSSVVVELATGSTRRNPVAFILLVDGQKSIRFVLFLSVSLNLYFLQVQSL